MKQFFKEAWWSVRLWWLMRRSPEFAAYAKRFCALIDHDKALLSPKLLPFLEWARKNKIDFTDEVDWLRPWLDADLFGKIPPPVVPTKTPLKPLPRNVKPAPIAPVPQKKAETVKPPDLRTPQVGERYYVEYEGEVFICTVLAVSGTQVLWGWKSQLVMDTVEDFRGPCRKAIPAPPKAPWWSRIFR
jgi:hypothetical protein